MGKFSRDKGKRGERMWAALCQEHGYDVHRTAQCRGNTGQAGDCEGLPGIHQEVKFVERLNVREALEQSRRDAVAGGCQDLPIVAHKVSRGPWTVTMYAEDFFQLYDAWPRSKEKIRSLSRPLEAVLKPEGRKRRALPHFSLRNGFPG